jgi:hypothetical protein
LFDFPHFLFLFALLFVSHFPHRSFFSCLFKPINAKARTTTLHLREISQSRGKVFAAMDCTSTGRCTDISFGHENAEDSILRNNESDSIKTDERDLQTRKQEEPIISTVRGMTIDVREDSENAENSILCNNESYLIKTDERYWQ